MLTAPALIDLAILSFALFGFTVFSQSGDFARKLPVDTPGAKVFFLSFVSTLFIPLAVGVMGVLWIFMAEESLGLLLLNGSVVEILSVTEQVSSVAELNSTASESATGSDPVLTSIEVTARINENTTVLDRLLARFIWEPIVDPNTENWVAVPVGPSESWAQIAAAGGAWTTIDNGTQESWTDKISPPDSSWKTVH
jgi:hypothetical protein